MKAGPGSILLISVMMALSLSVSKTVVACDVSQFDIAEKEGLPPYGFILFHKPGSPANDKSLIVLRELEQTWTNRANIVFQSIDVTTEQGKTVASKWEITSFPSAYVMAPTGWIAGVYTNELDKSEVTALITSPGKAALREALEKHKAVFLILGDRETDNFDAVAKACEKAVKLTKEHLKIDAGVLSVNPKDKREKTLLSNFGVETPPESACVYVTYGKGRAVLEPVESDIATLAEELSFRVQLLGTADQCSLGMEIFGEPLLLGK